MPVLLCWHLPNFYYKYRNLTVIQGALSGLRPAVVSLIGTAGLSILLLSLFGSSDITWSVATLSNINIPSLLLFTVSLAVLLKFKTGPISTMLGAGIAGMVLYHFF
jgi:chromate transporter